MRLYEADKTAEIQNSENATESKKQEHVNTQDKEDELDQDDSHNESDIHEGSDEQNEINHQDKTDSQHKVESQDKTENQSKPDNQAGTQNTPNTEDKTEKPDSSVDTPTTSVPVEDPYTNVSKEEFYANYKPATSLEDARYRSKHGFLSGSLEVPGQYAQDAKYQPKENDKYIRNTSTYYIDNGNTYVVVDGYGNEVMKIYKGGGYITLEEVAAYMYAFGGSSDGIPANYTSKKSSAVKNSIWGEYQRVNHSYFIGNTNKYPYEPELPNISGCGGELQYYEMDIGTTGTVTPSKTTGIYNNGSTINRGAARLVYARQDLNGNGKYEQNEVYVFYTHNHYNDFREYLNYYGGWGEMFGNVTGGGVFDSKSQCNPTPYVPTLFKEFLK